jgi:hypothetical protein
VNKATQSVRNYAIYLIILGLTIIAAPNLLLGLFAFPPTSEVWFRVVGVLATAIGYYYLQAARLQLIAFYRLTIHARCFAFLSFTAFVLLGYAKPMLILFGGVDLLGAIWTFFGLRAASTER